MMKKLLIVALLMLTTMVISGCQQDDRVTLRIGYWFNNENERDNNQRIIEKFEEMNPDVKVELERISYDRYGEVVTSRAVAGHTPDVLWIRDDYFPIVANRGIVQSLEPFMDSDDEFDETKYIDNALEFTKWNDIQYALPRDIGVQVMALNLDVFEAYEQDLPDPDWDWDEMIEVADNLTITDEDDRTSIYGLGWLDLESLLYSNGGRFFSRDGEQAYFDQPETLEAIQMYSDLVNVHEVAPTPAESQGLGNVFMGEKAAMSLIGPWDFSRLERAGINYDIRPFPSGPKGEGQMRLSGLPIGMSAITEHPDLAWDLIKFLSYSETAQTMQAELSIAMPSIESIARSDTFTQSDIAPSSMDLYFDALENTLVEYNFDGKLEAMRVFSAYLDEIYLGTKTTEELEDEIQQDIQETLDNN